MYILRLGGKLAGLVAVLLVVLLLRCSPGMNDWIYDELPNEYEIWRLNSVDIHLIKRDGESTRIRVDQHITKFCSNDVYIGIERLPVDDSITNASERIEKMNNSTPEYFLVDTVNDVVMGPYTAEAYEKQVKDLGIEGLGDWIATVPRPEGAYS